MKKLTHALVATGLAAAVLTPAHSEVSGNVTLGSDYIYRGISQTAGQSAISGGFDYEDESGFYVGTWASSIGFDESIEIDVYAGYGGALTESVDYDIGFLHYDYPGASGDDFDELYLNLSFGALSGGIAYSNDFFAGSGKAFYYSVGYDFELSNDWSLGVAAHLSDFDKELFGTEDSYADYGISISRSWQGVDISLTWTDTNLSNAECFGSDDCDSTVTFSISKSL